MEKLGFEVEYIHAGKTSVEQPWEMHLNRKDKAIVRGVQYQSESMECTLMVVEKKHSMINFSHWLMSNCKQNF